MTRLKNLTPTQRKALADTLLDVVAELAHPDAARVQQLLADAFDAHGHPTRTSDTPNVSTSGHSSATETVALNRPDPGYLDAARILTAQTQLTKAAATVVNGLKAWNPSRPVDTCPTCGNAKPRGMARCPWINPDTGTQCAARRQTRRCNQCERLVDHYLTRGDCDACRKTPNRHLPQPPGLTAHPNGAVSFGPIDNT